MITRNANTNNIDKAAVRQLTASVKDIIHCLEGMDDTTYSAVNDSRYRDGRYLDLIDWLHYLSNIR